MTKHYNVSIAEDALRILNSKQGDFLGDEVIGPVAVLPIERYANITKSATGTGASVSIFTTPSDKDFYLCSAELTMAKDATQDTASGSISLGVIVDGVAVSVLRINIITLQAHQDSVVVAFPKPIKLDRNSSIAASRGASTAGTCSIGACITGYTVETTR